MPSFYVKDVSEELLFDLQRLKAELKCRTWIEFLEKVTEILQDAVDEMEGKE